MNDSSAGGRFFGLPLLSCFVFALAIPAHLALAQAVNGSQSTTWAKGAISHAQSMRVFKDPSTTVQQAPTIIPGFEIDSDPNGQVATSQPGGPTATANNPFFQNLGTNGRTCFTCHQPQTGWTISAQSAHDRFDQNGITDPLFRLVDGATCPTDDVSTPAAQSQAYALLINKGLIRIGLAMPTGTQFQVTAVADPYNCTSLTSPTTGTVSVYRRPLPSTNLGFLSTIMWDGREPTLAHQSLDATLIHAQGNNPGPTTSQQTQMVNFESGVFTSQIFDNQAHRLLAPPSQLALTVPIPGTSPVQCTDTTVAQTGGPDALAQLVGDFFIGINDPLGLNPCGTAFTSNIFDLYEGWSSLPGNSPEAQYRESIARGEAVFNTKPINITGVGGLNDMVGNCGTCHDTQNVGDHSVKAPLNIGITDANPGPPSLDISGLPVFTLQCTAPASPFFGQTFYVTDPGRALISGSCVDIGKTKGPILRGLAARAPYFHNGSAATLMDAVNFYDTRFGINFTDQEKQDLVNFLQTL
jgi:cytochrome c peroxidase